MKKWIVIVLILSSKLFAQSGFVTMNCQNFSLNGDKFDLLSCAYLGSANKRCSPGTGYYLSPRWDYSSTWMIDNCFSPSIPRGTFGTEQQCLAQIDEDLENIKAMGFTTVRLNFILPSYDANGVLQPFTGSIAPPNPAAFDSDFELISQMINKIKEHDLKTVLLVMAGGMQTESDVAQFDEYLRKISSWPGIRDNDGLLAYDICNESYFFFHITNQYDKMKIAGWVNSWYYTLKKNDPNHLVTIGLIEPLESCLNWEPEMMNVDFVAQHLYAYGKPYEYSIHRLDLQLSWLKDNTKKPYIIGETGYSGSDLANRNIYPTNPVYAKVGTESEQKNYYEHSLQRSIDCNCKGYTAWQYREIQWNAQGTDYYEWYLGLRTLWPADVAKAAATAFLPFADYSTHPSNPSNCDNRPTNYLNIANHPNLACTGTVRDEFNNLRKDAVVKGIVNTGTNHYWFTTLTDNLGVFNLYTDQTSPVNELWISYPGSSVAKISNPTPTNNNATLKKINRNHWTKIWTNDNPNNESVRTNKIGDFTLSNTDQIVLSGDFHNQDGKNELMIINTTNNNNDKAELLQWKNGDNTTVPAWSNEGFFNLWDNGSNDAIFGWIIRKDDKFYVGNFDGLPGDELLCLQKSTNSNDWATILKFNGTSWYQVTSNDGSDWLGPWHLWDIDQFYVGNFDGVAGDELFCVQQDRGSSADWASFIKYTPGSGWALSAGGTNSGSDWIGSWKILTGEKYYIGDLDGNGKDDLFFCQNSGGGSDWMTLQTINASGNIVNVWSNNGSQTTAGAIYPYRGNLQIGNFEGKDQNYSNTADEIFAVMPDQSKAQKFDLVVGNFVSDWSISSTELHYFADWKINQSGTNTYKFFKPYKNAPDHLLAFNSSTGGYRVNMYAQNNHYECPNLARGFNPNAYNTQTNEAKLNFNELTIFPNPNEGSFTISSSTLKEYAGKNIEIKVVNLVGLNVYEAKMSVQNNTLPLNLDLSTGLYIVTVSHEGKLIGNGKIQITK